MSQRFATILFLLSVVSLPGKSQPGIIHLPELKNLLNPDSDSTYIINFWATWCKPCVKEIPSFEKINSEFSDQKVRVILVSLDFRRQYQTTLVPFVEKNKIKSEVLLIDEPDYNSWIDTVDPSWSGAIPATLIINKSKKFRHFYEKEFTHEELESIIKPLISHQP